MFAGENRRFGPASVRGPVPAFDRQVRAFGRVGLIICAVDTSTCYRIAIGEVSGTDVEALVRWITATGEAPLVSALTSPDVRPADIEAWLEASLEAWIVRLEDEPVALGTLSTREAELPENAVEACHVIVRPDWRRRFKGTQLLAELMGRARKLDYEWLVGRVVPTNSASHGFVQLLGWKPAPGILTPEDARFVWYKRGLQI